MSGNKHMSENQIATLINRLYIALTNEKIIIITGSKGIGKSYLISRIKSELVKKGKSIGGIATKANRDEQIYPKAILLYNIGSNVRAGEFGGNTPPHTQNSEVVVATRNENGQGLIPKPEVFNEVGTAILKEATYKDVLIIDEIGFLEETAQIYKAELKAAIKSKPSIIVLAKRDTPFIKELLQLENAVVFDLDEEVESLS